MRDGTVLLVLLLCLAASLDAQQKTPWGDPDIQGVWSNQNPAPLERPDALKGKSTLTTAEAAEFERTSLDRLLKGFVAPEVPLSGELNEIWLETAKGRLAPSRATSLVVDPPDGKVPYTPEGRKRWDATPKLGPPLPANKPEDRALPERCITTDGLLAPNPFYNNVHQIVQAPGYVAILTEMMHEARVIDPDTIEYRLTVTDPATFSRPWTIENGLRKADGDLYEVGCHEGNYGLRAILSGARAEEAR